MMNNTYENEGRTYVSPSCQEFQIVLEGVLCASDITINDWEENSDVL